MQDEYFGSLSERLIKSGFEEKVFTLLRFNMDASSSSSFSGALPNRMDSVMREFGPAGNMVSYGVLLFLPNVTFPLLFISPLPSPGLQAWLSSVHSLIRDQVQRERCELLSTLLMLYEAPGASAGALKCSGHRVLDLVRMMGAAVFPMAYGAGAAGDPNASYAAESGSSTALAEQLVRPMKLRCYPSLVSFFLSAPPPRSHVSCCCLSWPSLLTSP